MRTEMYFTCPTCNHQIYYLDVVIAPAGPRCSVCAEMPPTDIQQQLREAVRRHLLRREREVIEGARWLP